MPFPLPKQKWKIIILSGFFLVFLLINHQSKAATPPPVVINEIAWMGTSSKHPTDEWIELYNNTDSEINLADWGIYEEGGTTLVVSLTGIIGRKDFYLLERSTDSTISDIDADQLPSSWGGSGLKNSGEHLQLKDNLGNLIEEINCSSGWFAGDSSTYSSMERKSPTLPGNTPENWRTNDGITRNGLDADGNQINGTPRSPNSTYLPPTPTPTTPPTSTPAPEPTSTPTNSPPPSETPSPTPSSPPTPAPSLTPAPSIQPTPTPKPPPLFPPFKQFRGLLRHLLRFLRYFSCCPKN